MISRIWNWLFPRYRCDVCFKLVEKGSDHKLTYKVEGKMVHLKICNECSNTLALLEKLK